MINSIDTNATKEVIHKGNWGPKPYLNSRCIFTISCCDAVNFKEKSNFLDVDQPERLIEFDFGDGDTDFDREIEKCLQTMFCGEKSRFLINFRTNQITVEIQLVKLTFDDFIHQWSYEKKFQLALKYKEKGIEWKNNGDFYEASNRLSLAFKLITSCEPFVKDTNAADNATDSERSLLTKIVHLKNKIIIALAWCQYQNHDWEKVIDLTNVSLHLVAHDNVIAKKLRGLAYVKVKEYEKSFDDFHYVLKTNPNDRQVLTNLQFAQIEQKRYFKQYAEMSKKMLRFV